MTSLFKQPKAPSAPDPVATANAQSASNAETARLQQKLNLVDQYTPYGTTVYTPIGDDRYRVNVNLTPEGQKAFDSEQRIDEATNRFGEDLLGQVSTALRAPLDFSGLPSLNTDFSADRDKVTQALIDRNQGNMDRDQSRLENQLTNQGIARGSEAWNAAMDDLSRKQDDFRLGAINAGGAEQSRLFGINSAARQQLMNEMLTERSEPINELAALLGTGQVATPANPSIPQTGVNGTDTIGANTLSYNALMNNYNQQVGSQNSTMGGLFGLGGSALGSFAGSKAGSAAIASLFSDIRLKSDITRIGEENGLPIYTFRYRNDPEGKLYRGVMAQDVLAARPEAVSERGGYLAVDYGMLGIEFGEAA